MISVNPATVEDALGTIKMLGDTLHAAEGAASCIENLAYRLAQLDADVARIPNVHRSTVSRVLDMENDQLLVAGPLSFQYDVIQRAGGRNVSGDINESYPKVSFSQFSRWDPEVVFFCGYDRGFVKRFCSDKKRQVLRAVRTGRVYQFDCALTCRTGPRIVDMAELLFKTLYE